MTTTTRPITEIAAETKRLAEAATPGPWFTSPLRGQVYEGNGSEIFGHNFAQDDDCRFIAASRTNTPLRAGE